MTWFNEQDSADLPADTRSLVIAAANLLQRFEFDLPPRVVGNLMQEADRSLDYWSLERAFEEFDVNEYAEDGGWPATNQAIVKQRRMDIAQAGVVDHYSLVADQRAHSIIDSLDGKIKNASEYGPIISWASYTYKKQEDPQPGEEEPVADDNIHVLQPGENIWDVGRRYNIPVAALIAENDIEDPRHVPVGTELYLPQRLLGKKDANAVRYELLHPARPMHVSRESGAKKWSYGGVSKWADLYSTGRLYPQGHNLNIVAVAHVPIEGETAAYYLDAVSLGDYEHTGLPRYTSGFNWQHLTEGHTVEGTPTSDVPIEQVVADAMQEETRPELKPEPVPEAKPELPITPISYKSTFQFLNEERTPVVYLFKEALTIVEMDGKLNAKRVGKYDGVKIIGTFEKDGILYGRPALQHYWYGVPMDMLELEDELYNVDVDLPTRVAMRGQLSRSEQRLVTLSKVLNQAHQLRSLFVKK